MRACNVPVLCAPMPCTGRAVLPNDREAGWGGSRGKKRNNRAVPRRVLAQCMPPTEGVCTMPGTGPQGTKGTEEGHTAKPPAPQRGTERNRSGRGGQKETTPPATAAKYHASCLHRARKVHGGRTTRGPGRQVEERQKGRGRNACPPRTKQLGGEAAGRGRGTTGPYPQSARNVLAPNGGNARGGCASYEGRRREPHG